MPYVSPLKLLSTYKLPVEPKLDKDTLRIARQALLAEIDLSPQLTVTLGNKVMTRNDVLQMFDALQGDAQLKYHEALHADPVLLDFFTEGKIPVRPIANNPIYHEQGFVDFIAPFYPEMFAQAFENVVTQPSFERLNGLFSLPKIWETGSAKRETEVLVKQYLRKIYTKLEQFVEPNKGKTGLVVRKGPVEQFYHHHLLDALNRLPDSYTDFRTNFGTLLLELAYIFWNNKNRSESNLVARRVENIKGSYDLDYQVRHYWEQCTPQSGTSSSGGTSPWTYIVIVIFVIRVIVAIGRCESNSSRHRTYDLPTYTPSRSWEPPRIERAPSDAVIVEEAPREIGTRETPRTGRRELVPKDLHIETPKPVPVEKVPFPAFFNPEKDAIESLLYRIDSVAKAARPSKRLNKYEEWYQNVKSDTTLYRY